MADDLILQLEPRALTGKKVRTLRREGIIPGNVYGRGLDSVAVQASLLEFRRIFRAVDRNAVVTAQIAGEGETRPVVLQRVQRHPVSQDVQHVELHHIDVNRPIHATASLLLSGEAECEPLGLGGVLVQGMDTILLEALPLAMPAELTVDISHFEHFGQSVQVSDLVLPEGVRALADEHSQIVTVVAPRLSAEDEAELEGVPAEGAELPEGEVPPGEGAPEGAAEAASEGAEGS